jgi:hypothetical protein
LLLQLLLTLFFFFSLWSSVLSVAKLLFFKSA